MKKLRHSNKISPELYDENENIERLEMSENDSEIERNDKTNSIRKKKYQKLGNQSRQNDQKHQEKPIFGPDSRHTKKLANVDFTEESKISPW